MKQVAFAVIIAAVLAGCHGRPRTTTSDGLPVSDKPNVTGDGLNANTAN